MPSEPPEEGATVPAEVPPPTVHSALGGVAQRKLHSSYGDVYRAGRYIQVDTPMSTKDLPKSSHKQLYLVPTLSRAWEMLDLLEAEKSPRSLDAICRRLKVPKTTVFRILKTLVHRRLLVQTQNGQYRLVSRPKEMRFGFAGQSSEMPFSEAVQPYNYVEHKVITRDLMLKK